jgi:CheY-like chemotaxis protein
MPHALIVDNNEAIIEILEERLKSMDHTYEAALCQQEAEELLQRNIYDYILLDLGIPLTHQGVPIKQYGRNLLLKIKQMPGHKDKPVIAMTAHNLKSYHLAVEVMKDGAVDFVGKPFGEKHQLERKIHEALQKYPPRKKPDVKPGNAEPPKPFSSGILDFYADRVELRGEKIAGAEGETQMRQVLDLLKKRRLTKDKRSYDSRLIAHELNFHRGQSAVIDAVRQIRDACASVMLDKLNIECGKNDVVRNRDQGYSFAEVVEIRQGGTEPVKAAHPDLTANQLAILRELREQPAISRKVLSKRIHIRVAALNAEIADLVTKGIVTQTGNGAAMRYKLLNDPHASAP